MDHIQFKHEDPEKCPEWEGRYCMFCDGGIFQCSVCGGAEGSLPSECPGYLIPMDMQDAIYNGALDYKDGKWIDLK